MKKVFCMMLAAAMLLSLAACGKKDDNKGGDNTIADSNALLTTVWDKLPDDDKFPAAGGDFDHSVDDAPGSFDVSDTENLDYMLALPEDCAGLIDDAASLIHMMNANTFTCGAFRVKNQDDVSKVADGLHESIQSKQWMCGFPDKMVILTLDNYVVSMFGAEDLVNPFCDMLKSCYSAAEVVYDEPIA